MRGHRDDAIENSRDVPRLLGNVSSEKSACMKGAERAVCPISLLLRLRGLTGSRQVGG
jgi:hypothetical protein